MNEEIQTVAINLRQTFVFSSWLVFLNFLSHEQTDLGFWTEKLFSEISLALHTDFLITNKGYSFLLLSNWIGRWKCSISLYSQHILSNISPIKFIWGSDPFKILQNFFRNGRILFSFNAKQANIKYKIRYAQILCRRSIKPLHEVGKHVL